MAIPYNFIIRKKKCLIFFYFHNFTCILYNVYELLSSEVNNDE